MEKQKFFFIISYKGGYKTYEERVLASDAREAAFKFRKGNKDARIYGIRKC